MSRDRIIILLGSMLLFLPFLGAVHLFDWDEINFAESAREMLVTGNWYQVQINFVPFWEKPPLFFWMQALSMKVFGINEFAARLPNAICGIITLQVIFGVGSRLNGRRFGWLWVLLFSGSFLPFLYFKSGIIDPWFNLFIFLSVYFLYRTIQEQNTSATRNALIAGSFSGLAILTKGPVGFLLLLLTFLVWWVMNRFRRPAKLITIVAFASSTALVASLWFAYETFNNGAWFIVEFVTYQIDLFLNPVAGHSQPFFYHFVVVLLGCFPLSILALPAFSRKFMGDDHSFSTWMKYLFWVVMILFSIVTTKIVHYSSMAYLPLAYLAAMVVEQYIAENKSIPNWQRIWILVQGGIISVLLTGVPIAILTKERWLSQVKDPFAQGNLTAPLETLGWEWVMGLLYIAVIIISFVQLKRSTFRPLILLSVGTSIIIFGTMRIVVPMVESLSQRSAIEFFKEQRGHVVHLDTYGYKSYAHYFYGAIDQDQAHQMDEHELNPAKMPIMVSVKINKNDRFRKEYPEATLLYEQGGFAFYRIQD